MSRGVRVAAAFLALSGLLGASALGAVIAVHVGLEHDAPHGAAEHAHHSGLPTTEGHAHSDEPEGEVSGHSHSGPERLHPTGSPEHDHALTLTADLDRRAGRSSLDVLAGGAADVTRSFACPASSSPHLQPSRASPAAPAAPLSRRSVVLQL